MAEGAVLCLGEPLVEFHEVEDRTWRQGYGGDVSNVAVAVARQGGRAAMLTRLGGDGFGREFLEMWDGEGVDTSRVIRDPEATTGLNLVRHGTDGHAFEYRRAGSAASRMTPGDLPSGWLSDVGVLHLSAISQAISAAARQTCAVAMAQARAAGVRVSYDTNLRLALWPLEEARAVILDTLALADIVLPGLDDARTLTGLDDPEEIVALLLSRGPSVVALTMGADGALVGTAEGVLHVPGLAVDAVDATGAGDCFDGAFLARLAAGDAVAGAARYAAVAASLSTTGYGAVDPIPRATAVRAALQTAP